MTNYDSFLSRASGHLKQSAIRQMGMVLAGAKDIVSFAPGYPAEDVFPWEAFRAIAQELLGGADGSVLQYGPTHGYGPLRQMGHELALTFAAELDPEDVTILCDPVYFGGTVDRSEGSERIVRLIEEAGGRAEYIPGRDDCGQRIVELARPGDRVVVMGARDDTLTGFAKDVLGRLP